MRTVERNVITLTGGGPWGFRLQGGGQQTLQVAKVRKKSKAHVNSLQEGDTVVRINGVDLRGKSHEEAMALVDNAGDTLVLETMRGGGVQPMPLTQQPQSQWQPPQRPSHQQTQQRSHQQTQQRSHQQTQQRSHQQTQQRSHQQIQQQSQRQQPVMMFPVVNGFQPPISGPPVSSSQTNYSVMDGNVRRDVHTDSRHQAGDGHQSMSFVRNETVTNVPPAMWQPPTDSRQPAQQFPPGSIDHSSQFTHSQHSYQLSTQPKVSAFAMTGQEESKENIAPFQPQSQSEPKHVPTFNVRNVKASKDVWMPASGPSVTVTATTKAAPRAPQPPGLDPAAFSSIPKQVYKPSPLMMGLGAAPAPLSPRSPGDLLDTEMMDSMDSGQYELHHHHHHHHHHLPVFAPPVTITTEGAIDPEDELCPTPPPSVQSGGDGFTPDKTRARSVESDVSSLETSSIIRNKNLYGDSAFYDNPKAHYPTIKQQMNMCKRIAQSLTSAINKKARGARMFAKRKRKSSKWIHEGQSEIFSSSAGDVGDLADLDSELSPTEGGTRPLFTFRIPNLKTRVVDEEPERMSLTKDEFERLRLSKDRSQHKGVSPQQCFTIADSLKTSKGRGAKLFAKRAAKSANWVIDESNAKKAPVRPAAKLNQLINAKPTQSPWQAALGDPRGNVAAAFNHIDDIERMKIIKMSLDNATPQPPVVNAPPVPQQSIPPGMRHNLQYGEQTRLITGPNFNRAARGWGPQSAEYETTTVSQTYEIQEERNAPPTPPPKPAKTFGNYNPKPKAFIGFSEAPAPPQTYVDIEPTSDPYPQYHTLPRYGGRSPQQQQFQPEPQPYDLPGSDL